jgi:hypothetical protein
MLAHDIFLLKQKTRLASAQAGFGNSLIFLALAEFIERPQSDFKSALIAAF